MKRQAQRDRSYLLGQLDVAQYELVSAREEIAWLRSEARLTPSEDGSAVEAVEAVDVEANETVSRMVEQAMQNARMNAGIEEAAKNLRDAAQAVKHMNASKGVSPDLFKQVPQILWCRSLHKSCGCEWLEQHLDNGTLSGSTSLCPEHMPSAPWGFPPDLRDTFVPDEPAPGSHVSLVPSAPPPPLSSFWPMRWMGGGR